MTNTIETLRANVLAADAALEAARLAAIAARDELIAALSAETEEPEPAPTHEVLVEVESFEARLERFVAAAQEVVGERGELTVDPKGRKYKRIVNNYAPGQRSVYCFVNVETGDVLKAATWKAPADHARSNIWADDLGMSGISAYGAVYLR